MNGAQQKPAKLLFLVRRAGIVKILSGSRGWILSALLLSLFQAAAGPPGFSIPGGIYTNEIRLELSANPPGTRVHITLDRSEPTATSAVCSAALVIRKSLLVRARSFEGVAPSGEIISQTYPEEIDSNHRSIAGYRDDVYL